MTKKSNAKPPVQLCRLIRDGRLIRIYPEKSWRFIQQFQYG